MSEEKFRTRLMNLSDESQGKFFSEHPEWIDYYKNFEIYVKNLPR
jgi:hypothetical protein